MHEDGAIRIVSDNLDRIFESGAHCLIELAQVLGFFDGRRIDLQTICTGSHVKASISGTITGDEWTEIGSPEALINYVREKLISKIDGSQ